MKNIMDILKLRLQYFGLTAKLENILAETWLKNTPQSFNLFMNYESSGTPPITRSWFFSSTCKFYNHEVKGVNPEAAVKESIRYLLENFGDDSQPIVLHIANKKLIRFASSLISPSSTYRVAYMARNELESRISWIIGHICMRLNDVLLNIPG